MASEPICETHGVDFISPGICPFCDEEAMTPTPAISSEDAEWLRGLTGYFATHHLDAARLTEIAGFSHSPTSPRAVFLGKRPLMSTAARAKREIGSGSRWHNRRHILFACCSRP